MRRSLLLVAATLGAFVWRPCAAALTLASSRSHKHSKQSRSSGPEGGAVDVYYSAELLDKLKILTEQRDNAAEARFHAEEDRLNAALEATENETDKASLQATLVQTEQAKVESEKAVKEMFTFYYTLKGALGAQGAPAPTCELLRCGTNAQCSLTGGAPKCECKRCYQGDGFVCKPHLCGTANEAFQGAQPLPVAVGMVPSRNVPEIHSATFGENFAVVVLRDQAQGDQGFVQVGQVGEFEVKWSDPLPFSGGSPAFGPTVSALDNGRFLISYRDKDRGGEGFLVGGQVNSLIQPPTVMVRQPQAFAREQAQKVAMVPLSTSRVALLYSGHTASAGGSPSIPFGGAMLMQVLKEGSISILGKYHFLSDKRVSRIAATSLSPTSFIVAYRALPNGDPNPTDPQQEMMTSWIGMRDGELVVDAKPLSLEPERSGIWGRDVALISKDLLSVTYQSAMERKTIMQTIHVDPATHHLSKAGPSRVIGQGAATFVHSIPLAAGMSSPHAFSYFQEPGHKVSAQVCRVLANGDIASCSKGGWADAELRTASGARLKDGRLFLAYANGEGQPFYQSFGANEFMQG